MVSIAHPSKFDDWALGVKQVNPIVYYWTRIYVFLAFSGPPIAWWEETWPLPLPIAIGTVVVLFGMLHVGTPYDGIVKAMAVPHALGVGLATVITAQWVFRNEMVRLDESPISFTWACTIVPFCSLMTILDILDAWEWFVLRTRRVTRSTETVEGYIKKGSLPPGTSNVQWLMKRGDVVNKLCDEFGFLIVPTLRETPNGNAG